MRFDILAGIVAMSLVTAACSITSPVAVIGANGEVLRGSSTSTSAGGSFTVSDGRKLSCSGVYDTKPAELVEVAVTCNDGRRGVGVARRQPDGVSGRGVVHMNDGSVARFIFGPTAAALSQSPPPRTGSSESRKDRRGGNALQGL